MKKILLLMTAIAAVTLVGCNNVSSNKSQAELMAEELDRLCETKDSAAVIALDDSIHAMENRLLAAGDTAAIADFRAALKESRKRNAPYIATLRMNAGAKKEEVVKNVVNDVLNRGVDIATVTSTIDEINEKTAQENKE